MLCKNPYVDQAGCAYGCGQCMPCRYNKRRVWMHRIMLEAAQHEANAFVTLTYSDENMPEGGNLVPDHTRLWLNRLRGRVAPSRFRFFLVGEYGDETWRPHYHAALFGFRSCAYGQSRYSRRTVDCCHWCDLVRDTWGKGHVYLGTLEKDSAQYLAGYVTKKLTASGDAKLGGRRPEFARMSLKPGVAGDAIHELADALLKYDLDVVLADVPVALNHGGKPLPLGRYLRRRLREAIGRDPKIPQEAYDAMAEEMLALRMVARSDEENPSVKEHLIRKNRPAVRSFESKAKLFKKEKRL